MDLYIDQNEHQRIEILQKGDFLVEYINGTNALERLANLMEL